ALGQVKRHAFKHIGKILNLASKVHAFALKFYDEQLPDGWPATLALISRASGTAEMDIHAYVTVQSINVLTKSNAIAAISFFATFCCWISTSLMRLDLSRVISILPPFERVNVLFFFK
ncbi:MAG: hypothetical protein II777_06725, partial [Clostridia bacterium]|nr:hypothetical protein [Clostridia bacterium]